MIDDELDPLAVPPENDAEDEEEGKPIKKLEGGEESLDDHIAAELDEDEEEIDMEDEEESY